MSQGSAIRFSIVIPTYNGEKHLKATIDSALSQTFSGYEVIVVDDGSADGTKDIIKSYGKRITALSQANSGAEAARDAGFRNAIGEYIALLDHDDLLLPWTLATYDRLIRRSPAPTLILGSMTYLSSGEKFELKRYANGFIKAYQYGDFLSKNIGINISNSKIVVKRSVLNTIGGLVNDTVKGFPFDDYNLLLRVGTHGPCVIVEEPVTVLYRKHEWNTVQDIRFMCNGFMNLISAEKKKMYPGGNARRFARYSRLGGPAFEWTKKAMKENLFFLSLKIITKSWPMIMAAGIAKLSPCQKRAAPFFLQKECTADERR